MTSFLSHHATRRRPAALVAAFLVLSSAWVFGGGMSANSHNVVLSTTPEDGATVSDNPVTIRIVTNDKMLDLGGTGSGFAIVVRDANGLYYGDGCVTIGDTDMSTVARLGQPGDYTVTYQFVSADAHSLSDSFSFTFSPDELDNPAEGVDTAPVCGAVPAPVGEPVDETSVTDLSEAPDGVVAEPLDEDFLVEEPERGTITLAIAGVLIVLSITLLVWMVRRRNRG